MKSTTEIELEQLTRQESDVLYSLFCEQFVNQRILSETVGYSLGVVNRCLKTLSMKGYLSEHLSLTKEAHLLFNSRAPQNAIILAAGFGMRMVPINLTTPKALLEVKGEILIERIITQLQEVGVRDITVVVGFMKECFEYLIDEYGVKLAYASGYARTNNLHSLNVVSDKINNTYIIPGDIWCEKNPFRRNELYSWYMVSDDLDNSSSVRVNRKMELVKKSPKDLGSRMIGISYLTSDEAVIVRNRISNYVLDNRFDDKFWEETLYSKDKMITTARVVHSSEAVEINTYEELRNLDSNSNQLKTPALQIICEQFSCQEDDVVDIEVLKKGMTNRSFIFRINNDENFGRYIMRIPGEGTDQLIDRVAEANVYKTISGHLFCDDPIYINPDTGYKITKYIEDVRCCDPNDESDLYLCMKKLRKFHECKTDGNSLIVSHTFDLFERIDFYESLWNGKASVYRDYETTKMNCKSLMPFIEKHRGNMQLTHIDAVPDNFLFDPNAEGDLSIQLTDWEYAGMQDKHVDIAMFCIYSMYNKLQVDRLIDIYFKEDGGCNEVIRAKIYAYIAICGLLWSNWCEYKRNLGVEFGEYSLCQYRYAKEYYKYASKMINNIETQYI